MRTLAFFLSLFMFVACSEPAEKEIVVIPKGYVGRIVVIFNQKNGRPSKYDGEKRIYEIPSNGILKTQFRSNDGWRDLPEYYYGTIDASNKLPSFVEIEKIPEDTKVGFMGATGSVKSDHDHERLRFCEFYIGTNIDIEKAMQLVEKLDITKL